MSNMIFVSDSNLLMGLGVVTMVRFIKKGDSVIQPFDSLGIYEHPKKPDTPLKYVRSALVLGVAETRLGDIPLAVLKLHYDPERRDYHGLLAYMNKRYPAVAMKKKGRTRVEVLTLLL